MRYSVSEGPERAGADVMDKARLRHLSGGFYTDDEGVIYVYMREYLARHNMPDTAEVRAAVLEQVRKEFGEVKILIVEEGG